MSFDSRYQQDRTEETKEVLGLIAKKMLLPMFFAFWICDIFYLPELKWEFLGLRSLVIPIAVIMLVSLPRISTFKQSQILALFSIVSVALIINIMIFMIGAPSTPYYAGLNLISFGGLGFIPLSLPFFVITALGIYVPYYIIVFSSSTVSSDYASIVVNSFFIIASIIITLIIRLFREHLREKNLKLRIDLADEIDRRKAAELELIDARDNALSANEMKSAFLANMSHELRTPLNAIIGYADLLTEEFHQSGQNEYIQDMERINAGGKHLMSLISNVLDISKIESGRMDLYCETFDIAGMLKEIKDIVLPLAGKNSNTLIIDIPDDGGSISTDATKLQQLLLNLLSNACKFTKNGNVTLELHIVNYDNCDWLVFTISDTGIGMTPEQTKKVFQPFVQADSSTTKSYGGTGLGLAISQRFCQMMEGEMTVISHLGKGTVFTVYLPRHYGQETQIHKRLTDKGRRSTTSSVLLFDNGKPDVTTFLELGLINAGFKPTTSTLEGDAEDLIGSLVPSVVLIPATYLEKPSEYIMKVVSQLKNRRIPFIIYSLDNTTHGGSLIGFSGFTEDFIESEQYLIIGAEIESFEGINYYQAKDINSAINLIETKSIDHVLLNPVLLSRQDDVFQLVSIMSRKNISFANIKKYLHLSLLEPLSLMNIALALESQEEISSNIYKQLNDLVVKFVRNQDKKTTSM